MTDMRATERLLEVIYEAVIRFGYGTPRTANIGGLTLSELQDAITELRRRGDTLVRADDLRLFMEEAFSARGYAQQNHPGWDDAFDDGTPWALATQRLEHALGGKPL